MSIHFAAARKGALSPLQRALIVTEIRTPANDEAIDRTDDRLLYAALRHFGECGLGAARQARSQAEAAFFAGDRKSYDWWISICRTLDRRMAAELSRALNAADRNIEL